MSGADALRFLGTLAAVLSGGDPGAADPGPVDTPDVQFGSTESWGTGAEEGLGTTMTYGPNDHPVRQSGGNLIDGTTGRIIDPHDSNLHKK